MVDRKQEAERVSDTQGLVSFFVGRPTSATFEPVSTGEGIAALRRSLNVNTATWARERNLANYRANSARLKAGKGIKELDGLYRNGAAIIVGAGPSFNKNILRS